MILNGLNSVAIFFIIFCVVCLALRMLIVVWLFPVNLLLWLLLGLYLVVTSFSCLCFCFGY